MTEARPASDYAARRARAADTRERIVAAGAALLHDASIRDWRSLTVRAVAERAGVNERTVYRHFRNEQGLHDAVMHRFEEQAGIDLAGMRLEDVGLAAARILGYVASFPRQPRAPLSPTLSDASRRQREALLEAVSAQAPLWPEADRTVVAALFDLLWSVDSFERLVDTWALEPDEAIRGITWVMGLVEEAVRKDRRPE